MTECKNEYEIKGDYVVGYTARYKNEFYFDLDDFEKVKQYYWIIDSSGNVICKKVTPQLSMHKLLMGDGIYIHKNDNKSDNRKSNLVSARSYHNEGKIYLNGYIAIYMPEHERAFDNGCVYEHLIVAEKILGRKLKPEECVHHKDKNRTNNDEYNLMVFQTGEDHTAFHAGAECIQDVDGTYYCIKKFLKFTYYYRDRTRKDIDNNIVDLGSIEAKLTKDMCPYCEENYKEINAKMCINCYNKFRKENKKNIKYYKKISLQKDICPVCMLNEKHIRSKMCVLCARKEQAKNIPSKEELELLIYELPFTEIGKRYGVTDNSVRKWCKKYNLPYRKKDMKSIETN